MLICPVLRQQCYDTFAICRGLADQHGLAECSMGMSKDLETAGAAGQRWCALAPIVGGRPKEVLASWSTQAGNGRLATMMHLGRDGPDALGVRLRWNTNRRQVITLRQPRGKTAAGAIAPSKLPKHGLVLEDLQGWIQGGTFPVSVEEIHSRCMAYARGSSATTRSTGTAVAS